MVNFLDLHFCDDPGGGRSSHPGLAQGGAFQVILIHSYVGKLGDPLARFPQ